MLWGAGPGKGGLESWRALTRDTHRATSLAGSKATPSALSGSVHVLLPASAGQSRSEKAHLGIPTHTQRT
jgi:hypothetical protein